MNVLIVSRRRGAARMGGAALCLALGLVLPAAPPDPADSDFFEAEVRPVLIARCSECHGARKQESGLRVDGRNHLLRGGDSGPAIVPGNPDESPLIAAIRHEDFEMPPDGKLSPREIDALVRWVQTGAYWPDEPQLATADRDAAAREHWAFQPVDRPQPPEVNNADWGRTGVDRFLLAALESQGLAPAPEADRRTLIRRAAYALTGLPPTPADVEAFIADPDPLAYERLVDRLLHSPAYGEHWARRWLDLARYADTKGYVYGREERFFVHAHAYRDWVIRAFNDDLPYDRFLLLQIAADRAAPDDIAARAAMGFLTLGPRYLGNFYDILDDRIDVLCRSTLGLSVSCARCHDHKYDPIPIDDYYSLFAILRNSTEELVRLEGAAPVGGTAADPARQAFDEELKKREQAYATAHADARRETEQRLRARVADYLLAQLELESYPDDGRDIVLQADDLAPPSVRRWERYLAERAAANDAVFLAWRRFRELEAETFPGEAARVAQELMQLPDASLNPLVRELFLTPPATLGEAAARYGELFQRIDAEYGGLAAGSFESNDEGDPARAPIDELLETLYGVRSPCRIPDEPIVDIEQSLDTAARTNLYQLQGEIDRWLIREPLAPAYALALRERKLPLEARVLRRGDPGRPGALAPPRPPRLIAGGERSATDAGGRLELAQAIISRENPLTARVWVNRVWMQLFGRGLTTSVSDFGLRAEPPSHPELLDYLAGRFMDDGWHSRELIRELALSSTFRQSSGGPTDADERARCQRVDPENRLFWRMNPRRLTIEELRDTLLSVSGSLDHNGGGRPVGLFGRDAAPRRTIYGFIDRQFLPAPLRIFDFANPDLHVPQRAETTGPQQALFALNHPFVAEQARRLVQQLPIEEVTAGPAGPELAPQDPQSQTEKLNALYRSVLQRLPAPAERGAALAFVQSAHVGAESGPRPETFAWSYGYGAVDETEQQVSGFQPLPHFTGQSWQGGERWPDTALGWVRLTAEGGHAGNDPQHAAIRRWTAPRSMTVQIDSRVIHSVAAGDGVQCRILSSRNGLLAGALVHNREVDLSLAEVAVETGETIDFVLDLHENLNSDEAHWAPRIVCLSTRAAASETGTETGKSADETADDLCREWDAQRDFAGPASQRLGPWEQLAQTLLISN